MTPSYTDPIEQLMEEHVLILRMIDLIDKIIVKINETNKVEPCFIDRAVDFFKSYGDKTHHGKEEDILFRELGQKPLSDEHRTIMGELLEEHVQARAMIKHLDETNEKYRAGESGLFQEILKILSELSAFYKAHTEKENTSFFKPAIAYFTDQEVELMLKEFAEFDRSVIHIKYKELLDSLESENA
ncbi:hemerythrin domain-containing protein [Patescibacteria group bacterium]